MEQTLGFLGLKMLALCLVLTACKPSHISDLTYYQYKIGANTPLDSITVSIANGSYYFKDPNSNESYNFMITREGRNLVYKNLSCKEYPKISLNIGSILDHNCPPVFPFIGERITLLDAKIVVTSKKRYIIYKLYNEIGFSPSNSTTIFWEEHFGIILVIMENGVYYQIDRCDHSLMKSLKEDKEFSELWEIPSPVPPPD